MYYGEKKSLFVIYPTVEFLSYLEKNSSYVSGVSVCIFVALYVRMFVAKANKVEGTMS